MKLKNLPASIERLNFAEAFYYMFALAVLLRVFGDLNLGRLEIHEGIFYPYRKPVLFSLYPVGVLYLELFLGILGSAFLVIIKNKRIGAALIFTCFLMGLTQMFQHQKMLFLIVSFSLLIEPVKREGSWSIWFLKWQLIIIYISSAVFKLNDHFLSGSALSETLVYSSTIANSALVKSLLMELSSPMFSRVIAITTLIVECVIPMMLVFFSFFGIISVIIFHTMLAIFLSNVFPFSLLMISLSLLFLLKIDNPKS